MFTIIKDKYIRCFVGLFVFMFLSVAACNSYASVCFLPGGDCGETNDDLAFWCEPDDKDCNDANGTPDEYRPGDKPEKAEKPEKPDCTITCTPEDGHRTCTTDSNGCPTVGKECLNDKYLTEQACESDNNGANCKLAGDCYEVITASQGSCDGYNVAKSTLVALQTAFGVSSFDTFMSNLSTYTLEQCTACPADSTKFKCSYVGCPAGKTLYLNIDSLSASENGAKSMLSNTNITDYEEFSLEPSVFAKSSSVQKDSRSYAEACIMNKIKDNTLPNVCVQSQYCNGTDIYFQDSSNNHPDANKCVIKSIYCPIKDSRGLFNLSNIEIYDHDGNNCYYQYYEALSQTSSSTIALNECKKCLTGSNGYSLLPSNPKIHPAAITYNHSEFSFIPVDKTKRNMAIKMAQCDLSSLEGCVIGADFNDLLAGVTGYETAPIATSLCLDKNNIDSDYIDVQYIPYRQSVQQLMRAGLNDKNSKYYGKEDLVDYHVYVEHEGTSEPETGSCEAIQGQLVSYDTLYKFWEDNFKNYLNNEEDYYTDGWGYTYFPKEETFESFMANLSKYTLDECTTCIDTNGKTQYKCKYAGCPDGKDLYINKYVHYGPITTLFSNTTVSDYQYYSFPEVYQGYYDDNNITMIDEGYLLTPNSSCCSEARNLGVFDVRNYCTNWNMHCYGEDEIDLGYTGNLGYVEESSQGLRDGCSRSIYCKALLNGKDYGGYLEVDVLYGRNICQISSDSLADSCFTLLEYSLSQDPEFYNDGHPAFPDGLYRYVYDFNIDYLEADTHQIAHKDDDTMELNTLDGAGAICAGSEIYNYSERITDKYGAGSQDSWIIDDKSVVFLPPAQWLEENQ